MGNIHTHALLEYKYNFDFVILFSNVFVISRLIHPSKCGINLNNMLFPHIKIIICYGYKI